MTENLLKLFPKKRIAPYDGMSITASVWDTAHSYHLKAQQAHHLYFHGAGILTGLEVVASDPPDRLVYILPGVAVDTYGQIIVLTDPVAYDIGEEVEGLLYLFIAHRESKLSTIQESGAGDPSYLQDEFLISARSSLPEGPVIELARFQRQNRTAALNDPKEADHPRLNEIDQRYRLHIQAATEHLLTTAVIYLGEVKEQLHGRGLASLSHQLAALPRHACPYRLAVDDNVALDPGVLGYNLLCLVGRGKVQISATQLKGLQGYMARGGTLLVEALDEPAKSAFVDLAFQMGLRLGPLTAGHPLLEKPYLFFNPPSGFENRAEVLAADDKAQPGGFLLSTANYGALWAGKAAVTTAKSPAGERTPSREEIRAAVEWGANLLTYVIERQNLAAGE